MPNLFPSGIPNVTNDPEIAALDAGSTVTPMAASGALPVLGSAPITKVSAAALTLAAPVAGLPSVGGNDGRTFTVFDTTGAAHTITTPSNAINGNKHIATFGGTVGSFVEFKAYNGVWYALASSGVTLS